MEHLPGQHLDSHLHDDSHSPPNSIPAEITTSKKFNLREEAFQRLIDKVQTCQRCSRMEGRARVFGYANGPLNSEILFIAEAPGRLGADRSGIPLTGDQTGRNFDMLLEAAQFDRQSVFITNAVLCNPRNELGNNSQPNRNEIENCANHLHETIWILQPRFVVTLGKIALDALQHIEKHTLILSQDVGSPQKWNNRWLIPLYHPGPRARIYRSTSLQVEDFRRLKEFINSQVR